MTLIKRTFSKIGLLFLLLSNIGHAQMFQPPAGGNKKASVSEYIGITLVRIDYDRPAVNGREGKIWGSVVHYGFADLDYGTSKAAPWRAGANENTTFEFSTDVFIEGKPLPAGKYGFFIAMGQTKATLVFSKYSTAWGSFYYNEKDDALRVDVPVAKLNDSVERLKYEFSEQLEESAVVSLMWEKVKIPFRISVDLKKDQLAAYRKAVNAGDFYAYWQKMRQAANFCLVNNINLEEALGWADRSINSYFGEANFLTLTTYAGILEKLNRKHEADSIVKKAMPMATVIQLYTYGRGLLRMKENQKAYEAFKMNFDKYPKNDYANIGMIYGCFAIGNKAEALKYGEKSIALFKDSNSIALVTKLMDDIKAGKDIIK